MLSLRYQKVFNIKLALSLNAYGSVQIENGFLIGPGLLLAGLAHELGGIHFIVDRNPRTAALL